MNIFKRLFATFPKEIIISFIKEDLEGNYINTEDCPLARALKRIYPNRCVFVGGDNLTICSIFNHVYTFNSLLWNSMILKDVRAKHLESAPYKLILKKVR